MHIENCCRERDKYGYSQQQSKKSLVLHCRYLGSGRPWETATAVHYLGFVAVQISVVPISHAPKGTNPISDEGRKETELRVQISSQSNIQSARRTMGSPSVWV